MIDGDRVRQARELRGLTQTKLAKQIGVGQSAIARIERGDLQPRSELVETLALQTGFPPSFFSHRTTYDFPLGTLLFRARASMTSRERSRVHRYAQTFFEVVEQLSSQVSKIGLRLPRFTEEPITAARVTRAALGLSPDRPINHLLDCLERGGVLVLALPITFEGADAFSVWAGTNLQRPIVVVSSGKPGDRLRFSVAHEVGHLVMHQALTGSLAKIEREADRFAAEFLMPEEAMRQEIVSPVTLTDIAELKPRWRVSIQSLVRRARDLQIITERQYRYLFQQLSARGWRTREPSNLDIPVEKPRFVRKIAEVIYGSPIDYRKIASDVGLTSHFVAEFMEIYARKTELPRKRRVRKSSYDPQMVIFPVREGR